MAFCRVRDQFQDNGRHARGPVRADVESKMGMRLGHTERFQSLQRHRQAARRERTGPEFQGAYYPPNTSYTVILGTFVFAVQRKKKRRKTEHSRGT